MSETPIQRYDRVAILLHWFMALAILGQIVFGFLLDEFERNTPARAQAVNLHKSTGLVLAALVLLRLWWRLRHRPPDYPPQMPAQQVRAVRIGHALLYLCMIGMPLSGYLAANFSRYGIRLFNVLPMPPWGPEDKGLYRLFNGTHDLLALAFCLLIAGHFVLAIYHQRVARDGLMDRMSLK